MNKSRSIEREIITWGFAILIGVLVFYGKPFYILDIGETAIHTRLGSIVSCQNISGLYYKMPFVDRVTFMNTRIRKCQIETNSLSKDLQFVSIGIALNYQIQDALNLYKKVGSEFESVIINPLSQESIKAIVARYTAEELIQQRHEVKEEVLNDIRDRLVPRYIKLIDFNFVHLDFHDEFMNAVERKQIAQQAAMTERNLTEKVKQQMLQKREIAETEAYALKLLKENISSESIELKKIEKWNGVLPTYMGTSTPLITLK